jgi:chromosome segregation ATPase
MIFNPTECETAWKMPPAWCDIPRQLATSTKTLLAAKVPLDALDAEIVKVKQQLARVQAALPGAKRATTTALGRLQAAVVAAQSNPSATTIATALATLEETENLRNQIETLQRQEAAYNDMLTNLAAQTNQTVVKSAELLAEVPEAMQQ